MLRRTSCPVSEASSGDRPCPGLESGWLSARPPRALPGAGAPIARASRSQPRSSQSRGTDRRRSRRCDGRRATEARASPSASRRAARRPRPSRERSRNESGLFPHARAVIGAVGEGREASKCLKILVGVSGFEPPTPASRRRCSARLSYTPTEGARGRVNPPPLRALLIASGVRSRQAMRRSPRAPRPWPLLRLRARAACPPRGAPARRRGRPGALSGRRSVGPRSASQPGGLRR